MTTPIYDISVDSGIEDTNPQNQVLPTPSTTPKPYTRVSPSVLVDVLGNRHAGECLDTAEPGAVANTQPAGDHNQVVPTLNQAEPPSLEYGAYSPPTSASGDVAMSCPDGSGGLSHTPSTQHYNSTTNGGPSQLHPTFPVGAVTSPEEEMNPQGAIGTTEMVTNETEQSIQDMKSQLVKKEATIALLKGELEGSKSQNQILQQNFDDAKTKFKHELKWKNDEVKKFKGEAEGYRVQLSNLQKKNEEERVKHEREIQCYEGKLKQLEETVESKEKEIDRMKYDFRFKELEHAKEKSDLEKDILKNEVKICKMETQEESLRRQLAEAREKIAVLGAAKMKEENGIIKEENATIKEENVAVRAELQHLRSMNSVTSSLNQSLSLVDRPLSPVGKSSDQSKSAIANLPDQPKSAVANLPDQPKSALSSVCQNFLERAQFSRKDLKKAYTDNFTDATTQFATDPATSVATDPTTPSALAMTAPCSGMQ